MVQQNPKNTANIQWQKLNIDKQLRSNMKNQRPVVLWFTGLSASGKTTIANVVEQLLYNQNKHTILLDGDNLRHGLNSDLGFASGDRIENVRRIGETAKLMLESGLVVLVSCISPFINERRFARNLMGPGQFIEIFLDASIELCASRDPKGLYKKARNNEIKNFTGIDSPYEIPEKPDIIINSANTSPQTAADQILQYMGQHKYL